MRGRSNVLRVGLSVALASLALALVPSTALGVFHLMQIREVATNPAGADSSYVELQMYDTGQNQVGGHLVRSYTAAGGLLGDFTIPSNVGNGDNQRTILLGDTATPGSPDFVDPVFADYFSTIAGGGAVCFENIDCVSWGAFTGAGSLPSPTGTPAAAIPAGSALSRSICAGNPSLLEASDDTNNSAADFQLATPSPTNNSALIAVKPCDGSTTNLKCKGKQATLTGTSGADNLKGTQKRDVIVARGGKDKVNGRGGNDLICGEGGKDTLVGGGGKDTLVGGRGGDKLLGGAAKDKLIGQAGNDTCVGGARSDTATTCEKQRSV